MSDDSSLHVSQRAPTTRAKRSTLGALRSASAQAGLEHLAGRLDELREWLAADLAAVELGLGELGGRDRDVAERAAAHLLGRRGKRIRPVCVLLGALLSHVDGDARARDLAIACELVHAATLLHDDVIDDGAERRGAPAARVVFGNSASVLAGDYLLIEALERVQKTGCTESLTDLLATIAQMVAAEALQLERRGTLDPSRELYLRIVDGKTASLFRWALCAGARLGHLEAAQANALAAAGMALGRAFQLIDDALDFDGDAAAVQKDMLADLVQGKVTWPLIVAAERDASILTALRELTSGEAPKADDLAAIVERVRAAGGVEAARALARREADAAARALAELPDGRAKAALAAVIEAAVDRQG
jgi:octaprenyl-diphosphate synthase